ncbi:MAG TPA: hypothetical protein VFX30_08170 [bacterium]|nr:hypothetical protein [bacterium]
MTPHPRTPPNSVDQLLAQVRTCLDAAAGRPGLVQASVYQTEGYLRGIQALPWETPATAAPPKEDTAAAFLHDVRKNLVPLRGRVKKQAKDCLRAFESGFLQSFPEARGKQFASAAPKLWVRWLGSRALEGDPFEFSLEAGRRAGDRLKREYEEGVAGSLAPFLLDKRLHLDGVRDFLFMRGWLLGVIENFRQSEDKEKKERAGLLEANLSSIVLRAQHHAGPGYAALAVERLTALTRDLDLAVRNLADVEPEASSFLRNNRSTIIARALHSGLFDYGGEVVENLPSALKGLDRKIAGLEASSPATARILRSNKRTVVYRALTNGHLNRLKT